MKDAIITTDKAPRVTLSDEFLDSLRGLQFLRFIDDDPHLLIQPLRAKPTVAEDEDFEYDSKTSEVDREYHRISNPLVWNRLRGPLAHQWAYNERGKRRFFSVEWVDHPKLGHVLSVVIKSPQSDQPDPDEDEAVTEDTFKGFRRDIDYASKATSLVYLEPRRAAIDAMLDKLSPAQRAEKLYLAGFILCAKQKLVKFFMPTAPRPEPWVSSMGMDLNDSFRFLDRLGNPNSLTWGFSNKYGLYFTTDLDLQEKTESDKEKTESKTFLTTEINHAGVLLDLTGEPSAEIWDFIVEHCKLKERGRMRNLLPFVFGGPPEYIENARTNINAYVPLFVFSVIVTKVGGSLGGIVWDGELTKIKSEL